MIDKQALILTKDWDFKKILSTKTIMEIHETNMMVHLLLIFWIKKKNRKRWSYRICRSLRAIQGAKALGFFLLHLWTTRNSESW